MGQELVKNDAHIFFEIISYLATSVIDFVNDMNESLQASLGVGFFHQLFNQFNRGEDHALAGASKVREKAMFNRVVFGTVGRIMGDTDFETDFVDQVLEVSFENVMPGTITPSPVTQDQNGGGFGVEFLSISVPPMTKAITRKLTGVVASSDLDIANIEVQIVQTMRNNDPACLALEIVIPGLDFFQSIQPPCAIEIA